MLGVALVAAEEEPNPIVPAANELIWGTVAFVLLLAVLWRAGVFQRIREALEERRRRIQGNIEEAERIREEAERLLQQYRDQLARARDESNRILEDARQRAEEINRDIQARAEREAERIISRAQEEIRAERDRAERELRGTLGELVVDVAERVVGESLDGERQLRLVDDYIEELTELSEGEGGGRTRGRS